MNCTAAADSKHSNKALNADTDYSLGLGPHACKVVLILLCFAGVMLPRGKLFFPDGASGNFSCISVQMSCNDILHLPSSIYVPAVISLRF